MTLHPALAVRPFSNCLPLLLFSPEAFSPNSQRCRPLCSISRPLLFLLFRTRTEYCLSPFPDLLLSPSPLLFLPFRTEAILSTSVLQRGAPYLVPVSASSPLPPLLHPFGVSFPPPFFFVSPSGRRFRSRRPLSKRGPNSGRALAVILIEVPPESKGSGAEMRSVNNEPPKTGKQTPRNPTAEEETQRRRKERKRTEWRKKKNEKSTKAKKEGST